MPADRAFGLHDPRHRVEHRPVPVEEDGPHLGMVLGVGTPSIPRRSLVREPVMASCPVILPSPAMETITKSFKEEGPALALAGSSEAISRRRPTKPIWSRCSTTARGIMLSRSSARQIVLPNFMFPVT